MRDTRPLPNKEVRLLEQALEALHRATGLEGRVVALEPQTGLGGRRADALIEIGAEEQAQRYAAEIKPLIDRRVILEAVKAQLDLYRDPPGLLITTYITPELADCCRQLRIPFIDAAGNAFLYGPGLYAFVRGHRRPDPAVLPVAPRAATPTALRTTFALLCRPQLLNAPYRGIAQAAGVALGAIGWVFQDLAKRGYIAGDATKGNRRFLEPKRLFEEWVTNYPIKLRPKLNPQRFCAPAPDWWQRATLADVGALWGGEVAADKLTGYLKPAAYTLYLRPEGWRENLTRLVAANRLRADPAGNIEILEAFWNFPPDPEHPDLVPPILVYADLLATLDPRNLDTARQIYDRYIAHALH